MKILVTGGAGFIGGFVVRDLLQLGAEVTVFDNFSPQIHGNLQSLSPEVAPHVKLIVGDVQDLDNLSDAVAGQEIIVHLAAETGTGQSMYEVTRYERVNIGGTANLLQAITADRTKSLKRLVVASSRAVYGEGCYLSPTAGVFYPEARKLEDLIAGRFEPLDPMTGESCQVLPTKESAPLHPSSIYGLTKQVQEQMCLMWGRICGFSAIALRYQNVYGPGQSLKNPYTGILAIFSNQARLNQPIKIFEDGKESRDFVYVQDVADATVAAAVSETSHCEALNVGSGVSTSVLEVVSEIVSFFGSRSQVAVTGAFRLGDIRHCVADLQKIHESLGFVPKWSFRTGVRRFLEWASNEEIEAGGYLPSLREMKDRGLYYE